MIGPSFKAFVIDRRGHRFRSFWRLNMHRSLIGILMIRPFQLFIFCATASVVGLTCGRDAKAASSKRSVGDLADIKPQIAEQRKRVADGDQEISRLRSQAKGLADHEESLRANIDAKKQQRTAVQQRLTLLNSGATELANQQATTSATLASQRQTERELAERIADSNAALWRQSVAQRAHLGLTADPREALALYLTALDTAAVEQKRDALADSIRRLEQTQQQTHLTLTQSGDQRRETLLETDKLTAEIKGLEKQLQKLGGDRQGLLARAETLSRVRKSAEKEIARLEALRQTADLASKRAAAKATPAKPTPSAPTPTPQTALPPPLAPNIQSGTGLDFMVSEGTVIHAIEAGEVIYADRFKGYGNLVIIEHADKTLSLYGFLNQIEVIAGKRVAPGTVIGRSGFIEDKDKPGLRFEMRAMRGSREELIDPRIWLPKGADLQRRLLRGTD